ncbi:MAG: YbfB/YjiJ family MFS transporter [SAR324 cluster bacterium]|nr:YbfB/YjiJ family MFS transporter [SAR324 cluster bacterium]
MSFTDKPFLHLLSVTTMFTTLLSGALSLFLGMGVARFAFTPILPLMQSDFVLSDTISGALASANYLGYLLGAFYVKKLSVREKAYPWFLISVVASLAFIGLMWFESHDLWYAFRFLSGFFSGLLFVLSSEFILAYLIEVRKPQYFGIIYSGIGTGMVLSGLTVPMLSDHFNSSQIWLWLAGLSVIPAVFVIRYMPKSNIMSSNDAANQTEKNRSPLTFLYVAYFLEGFGYIVTGTFISVIVLRGTGSVLLSGYVWVIAGLGAVFITPVWPLLSKRYGIANILVLTYFIQSIAIAIPIIFSNTLMTILGAIGYGGTFLGVVSLVIAYGKNLSPTGNTIAVLTIFFSLGQVLGPLSAGWLSDVSGGFDLPVLLAAAMILLGGIIILINKGEKHAIP